LPSIKDFGLMLEPQLGMSPVQLVETARLAEELGFGYLFRSDHLLPTDGRRGIDSPECWTSLGAIAASTKSLKFGPMVTPIGFRNPALLARMACTVHSLSGGRLQLSMGAGWYEAEYIANGFRFPQFTERLGQFREALTIVTSLVREGRADFDGKYFTAHTDCLPRPSGRLHLIIGAKSKSMVRLAARVADEWNVLVSPSEVFKELKEVFDAAVGSRKVLISEMGPFIIGRNEGELEASARLQASKLGQAVSPQELLKRIRGRNALCGIPEDFLEQVRAKVDAGIGRIFFQTLVPENTDMIELLADTLQRGF
jgi:alkanesulfonate monooxygenase SsuD/methylene tetrahydromethanopterin reductase-like flavin-dependent oxidoreductase (luciferase family)